MRGHWVGTLALAAAVVSAPALAQTPKSEQHPKQFSGVAAHYSKGYRGKTAAGDRYDPEKFTAAHKTLPFGTRLRVTDKRTGRSVEVVVNDRGPFTRGRVLDLSLAAAKELGMLDHGLLHVTADIQ
jgi:rare lipoprotein A